MLSTGGRDARIDGRGSLFALGDIVINYNILQPVTLLIISPSAQIKHVTASLYVVVPGWLYDEPLQDVFDADFHQFNHRCIERVSVFPAPPKTA